MTRTCQRCGSPVPAGSYANKRYCRKACVDLASAARRRRAAGKPRDRVTRSCKVCLRSFSTTRFNQVYCGPKCKTYALNKRRIDQNRKSRRQNSPPPRTIAERAAAIRSTWDAATLDRRLGRSISTTKATGRHVKTGEPIRNEYGREALLPSQHEHAKAGAFLKHLASRGGLGVTLTKSERDLLNECLNDRWCGKYQSHYLAGLPGAHVKALLNDSLSGGVEVVPEWFDDNLITFPLLSGELFPFVDLRPVPRANSVEGASVGNPTVTWGTPEGTEVALFSTASLIAEINSSIFAVTCAIEVGRDLLADAAADVGRTLTENVGQRMTSELDRVVAVGNGSSEPQGIFNASGLGSATTDNGNSGPPTLDDYLELMFAVGKQYRTKAMRPAFISNDVSYRRSRAIKIDPAVTSTDQRPVFGLDATNSYQTLDWPHRIQTDIGNTTAAFAALARYRLYRRQGFEVRWEQGGKELARKNCALLIVRGRFGGRLVDANAAAKWTNGQS